MADLVDPHVPWMPGHEFHESSAFAHIATLLAPDARLVDEPRVTGRITYGAGTTYRGAPTIPWRVLRIVTRSVWAYAFEMVHSYGCPTPRVLATSRAVPVARARTARTR